jgi:hypothetical protein
MKTGGLIFCAAQKSAQGYETKEVGRELQCFCAGWGGHPPSNLEGYASKEVVGKATCKYVKTRGGNSALLT